MSNNTDIMHILEAGEEVRKVTLDIDYQIIEHFSRHLYGSPNKAVEELVSNAFDALARNVYIYLPGKFTTNHVVVWDNGSAMDAEGLEHLWEIAHSPKAVGERIAKDNGTTRKMIGKFGIGKLASYSVGRRLTHLCRRNSGFLLISVDYNKLHGENGQASLSKRDPYETPIIKLTETQAREYVNVVFGTNAESLAVKRLFGSESWTLAAIDDLKEELTPKRLAWVLGTGMPLRPDFNVSVNDEAVTPKLEANAKISWDFRSDEIRQNIQSLWKESVKNGDVEGDIRFGEEKGLDMTRPGAKVPYVEFPNLKKVFGDVRLFGEPQVKGKAADTGRSHGFFIFVRGRLLNPDNDKLLLKEPSFGSFYRSQFILNIDGLDEDLLADRERLSQNTPRVAELNIIQTAVYRATRTKIESDDDKTAEQAKTVSLLPIRSREYYREPMTAFLTKTEALDGATFDIGKPEINRVPVGYDEPLAVFSSEKGEFQVNTSHPFYVALEKRMGGGKKAREFFRAFDLFSVSERLLEGHLYSVGITDDQIQHIIQWRDGLFRELAINYDKVSSDLAIDLTNASYQSGKPFEEAVANILQDMGFRCERDGASGKKDVLLVATIGAESYTLTFEPKGCVSALPNDKAEVSGAASHRNEAGAEHAIIVAREFVGFGKNQDREDAAVLKECKESEVVSVMTVEALINLHEAIDKFGYPLDLLKEVFCEIETPKKKLERIQKLKMPTEDFDYKALLDELWNRQGGEASEDLVPYKHVYQTTPKWKKTMDFEDFQRRLTALETMSNGRLLLKLEQREVVLKQSPEKIVEQVERSLNLSSA